MANLGGGAEAHARFKQYEYRANSSLVLTTDSRPRDSHEPETLWGRIDPRSLGDRAVQARPPELEEKLTKKIERDAASTAVAAASSVVPAPDAMDDTRAASAALKEKMIRLGWLPSPWPPPKRWWFLRLAGWFTGHLTRLRRLSLVDILHRRDLDADRKLVKDCLDHYNRQHPGNEYEPLLGIVIQNSHLHYGGCWVHGNFVARKKGSGVFSFLTAPRSVFFFELAYMDGFKGVVTCTTVEEPAYSVLGCPLWLATRTSGKLDTFCKTCYCRFGIPRPGVQKISACGHNNVAEVCEMCYCCSHTLHPDPGEFAFGYRHPYKPYPKR